MFKLTMHYIFIYGFLIFLQVNLNKAQTRSCIELQLNLTIHGTCPSDSQQPLCADLCRGFQVVGEDACRSNYHCCFFNGTCILKQLGSWAAVGLNRINNWFDEGGATPPEMISVERLAENFFSNDSEARFINPGQGPILTPQQVQNLFSYVRVLPKFPESCRISPDKFQPQVNIPYCQRIACQPGNPFLETNPIECISKPGCAFDSALYTYRTVLNQGILPTVPVCHYAVRNQAFHFHANRFAQQNTGGWNPYLTECLIDTFATEILTPSKECSVVSALHQLGYKGKHAGWTNINERECNLINGCWINQKCYYPYTPQIKTRPNYHAVPEFDFVIQGKPMCQLFDDDLNGGDFLNAYYSCLSSGCSANVDSQSLLQAIHNVTISSLPVPIQQQYWTMALLGEVRADNWEKIRNRLINDLSSNNFLNRLMPSTALSAQGSVNSDGVSILPFTLAINASSGSVSNSPFISYGTFGQFGNQNRQSGNPDSRSGNIVLPPSLSLQNFDSTLSNPTGNAINDLNSRLSGIASLPSQNSPTEGRSAFLLPCPFQPIQWPNFPPLTGSFAGCCEIPKCYIPRIQIRNSYSEIASYTTLWTTWSPCSNTCGGGTQTKRRFCIGEVCGPPEEQKRPCNVLPCPVYGPWSEYTTCSATCGRGTKLRTRVCAGPGQCSGPASETTRCMAEKCPRLVKGNWSTCSTTCGEGTQTRVIRCQPTRQVRCSEDTLERRACQAYCGRIKPRKTCSPSTCFFVIQQYCIQDNEQPGHCRKKKLKRRETKQKCYAGRCCKFHKPPNRAVCRRGQK